MEAKITQEELAEIFPTGSMPMAGLIILQNSESPEDARAKLRNLAARSVTHADFIRGASFLASRATKWAGEIAINIMSKLNEQDEFMDADALRRFRADILEMLNSIAPPT